MKPILYFFLDSFTCIPIYLRLIYTLLALFFSLFFLILISLFWLLWYSCNIPLKMTNHDLTDLEKVSNAEIHKLECRRSDEFSPLHSKSKMRIQTFSSRSFLFASRSESSCCVPLCRKPTFCFWSRSFYGNCSVG